MKVVVLGATTLEWDKKSTVPFLLFRCESLTPVSSLVHLVDRSGVPFCGSVQKFAIITN